MAIPCSSAAAQQHCVGSNTGGRMLPPDNPPTIRHEYNAFDLQLDISNAEIDLVSAVDDP
jgi:hypothetical protein